MSPHARVPLTERSRLTPLCARTCRKMLYDEQVEYHGDGAGGLKPLTYENLSTPVLSAFIKEVLRMHPPIHSIMRKVIADVAVPSTVGSPSAEPLASAGFKKRNEGREYVVPKGNYVLAAPGFSQMDKGIWGADAEEFRVERWLQEGEKVPGEEDEGEEDYGWGKISKGGKSACESARFVSVAFGIEREKGSDTDYLLSWVSLADLPFGAGRHRCSTLPPLARLARAHADPPSPLTVGEQFANVQLGTIIATLVREMTWTLDQPFPGNDYTVRCPFAGSLR